VTRRDGRRAGERGIATVAATPVALAVWLAQSLAFAADALPTTPATTATCPPPGASWLRVTLAGDGATAPLRETVLRQMSADLGAHGVVACAAPAEAAPVAETAPIADVSVALTRGRALSLEVRDDATNKRLGRELSLATVPADAIGLAVALAAEELLHASWIEAALAPPPAPAPPPVPRPVPAAVRRANDATIAQLPRAFTTQAALVGAVERAGGGQTGVGADVRLAWGGRLTVGTRVGARAAPDVTSAHGTVHGHELLAGLVVAWALVPRDRPWGGELFARGDVLDVQVSGDATAGGRGSSGSALGVLAGGGVGGWLSVGAPWRIVAEVAVEGPVRAVTASDAGSVATGVSGVVVAGALGLGASL